jgi:translation elongation factor P/translation initiation factor 5A
MATNYFESDSLQKKIGYIPPRVYLYLRYYNLTNDSTFLPIKATYDTLSVSSCIKITYQSKEIKPYHVAISKNRIIAPRDSMFIFLKIDLYKQIDIDAANASSILHNFFENMQCHYELHKSDSTLSKIPLPDTVIIESDKNLRIEFRDEKSFDEDIQWI